MKNTAPRWEEPIQAGRCCRFPIRIAAFVGLAALAGAASGCGPDDRTRANGSKPAEAAAPYAAPAVEPSPAPPARAARIVSLSPLATRFLVELGVGAQIVAVDPASQALPGFEHVAVTTLAEADRFDPSLVVTPALAKDLDAGEGKAATKAAIVEFAPHDLEDVYMLCRSLGQPLVGEEEALLLERRIAWPIGLVAGQSPPDGRPRVVAVVAVDPLAIAGGHSFETDLIEAAGGTSATHGSDDEVRRVGRADLMRLAPDLLLVTTKRALSSAEQERVAQRIGDLAPVAFFDYDRERFWLVDTGREAERLHALIATFRADTRSGGEPKTAPVAPRAGSDAERTIDW